MDARQLEYFLAIVEHGGFRAAASHLHIAQPSLSQAIAGLERELGVALFHRIGRKVVLSDAGHELVGPARQVARELRTARAAIESVKGIQRGCVELITTSSPGIEPLSTLTARFAVSHPGVTILAAAAFTAEDVVRSVKQGVCELGFVNAIDPIKERGIDVLHLEAQPYALVGGENAPFNDGDNVSADVLATTQLIVSPRGTKMRAVVDDVIAQGVDLRIVIEVAHRTSILPLVLRGVGVAVLPAAWVPLARSAGARVATLSTPRYINVGLLSRKGALSPAARAFLDTAKTYTPTDYFAPEQHRQRAR